LAEKFYALGYEGLKPKERVAFHKQIIQVAGFLPKKHARAAYILSNRNPDHAPFNAVGLYKAVLQERVKAGLRLKRAQEADKLNRIGIKKARK
jgi:ATP-dependent 26S proteasome regulatory subunit